MGENFHNDCHLNTFALCTEPSSDRGLQCLASQQPKGSRQRLQPLVALAIPAPSRCACCSTSWPHAWASNVSWSSFCQTLQCGSSQLCKCKRPNGQTPRHTGTAHDRLLQARVRTLYYVGGFNRSFSLCFGGAQDFHHRRRSRRFDSCVSPEP